VDPSGLQKQARKVTKAIVHFVTSKPLTRPRFILTVTKLQEKEGKAYNIFIFFIFFFYLFSNIFVTL